MHDTTVQYCNPVQHAGPGVLLQRGRCSSSSPDLPVVQGMSTMPDPASACRCTFQPGPSQGHINSVPDKSPRSPTECVIAERMHLHAVRLLSAPKQRVVQHAGTCCGCSLCKSSSFAGRWGWYDKYFAYTMAYGMQDYERNIAARKETLFANLFQLPVESLLEIGIGTGPNTRYYAAQQVHALMHRWCLRQAWCQLPTPDKLKHTGHADYRHRSKP